MRKRKETKSTFSTQRSTFLTQRTRKATVRNSTTSSEKKKSPPQMMPYTRVLLGDEEASQECRLVIGATRMLMT